MALHKTALPETVPRNLWCPVLPAYAGQLLSEPSTVKDESLMFRIIRASFNQRRKTLLNGLNNSPEIAATKEQIQTAFEKLGFPANVRGETLTLKEFAALADEFAEF